MYSLSPMDADDARVVLGWRYSPPYDLYNGQDDDDVESMVGADYWSIRDDEDVLVAFACFGEDARVSGGEYSGDALDVGCGMRPDRTGRGAGSSIIRTAVDFGRQQYGATTFRATIAGFNTRAQRAAAAAGFRPVGTFRRPIDGLEFVILLREDSD